MIYHVRIFGDPVLREKSEQIGEITDDIRQLAQDMIVTMRDNNGAGLAAQQIGRTERICIVDIGRDEQQDDGCDDLEMPVILINPEIEEMDGEQVGQEGCLSFPEVYVNVARANQVVVTYQDLTGEKKRARVSGLLSRAVQHELDHLNAVLLVDHMSPVQKVAVSGKLKRMKRNAASGC